MAKPKLNRESLVIVIAQRVGMIKGARVLQFIWSWGVATEKLGHPPESMEQYADHWRISAATAYREQQLFREALPGETTPERIWTHARREAQDVMDRKTGPARIGNMILPA